MRAPLILALSLVLAGCAAPGEHEDHETPRWTFTEKTTEDDERALGNADGFAQTLTLNASANKRQIGGQYHGPLAAAPFTLLIEADVEMVVGFRLSQAGGTGATGRCDWGTEVTEEKSVGLATARIRSTSTTCEMTLTPSVPIQNDKGATFHWEARSNASHETGWTLRFTAK